MQTSTSEVPLAFGGAINNNFIQFIKNEEVIRLKKQLSDTTKVHEDSNVDRANTINRLAKSLEESQRQCSELLEAGMNSIVDNCNFWREFHLLIVIMLCSQFGNTVLYLHFQVLDMKSAN